MTESSVVEPSRTDEHVVAHPKRVRWTLGLVAAGIFVALAGVPGVLISLQLSHLDPAGRLSDLAVISAVGALVNVIMIPVWGSISDRTRSRLGRRAPIAITGTAIVLVALVVMATAPSVIALAVGACLLQFGFAGVTAPLSATIPDRVGIEARGVASSILGFGIMFGSLVGQLIGAPLAQVSVPLAYAVGGLVYFVTLVVFIAVNPEPSTAHEARRPVRPTVALRSFWVSPRAYPDFAWAFWARGFMFLGYAAVTTYGFYILEDYIGLSEKQTLATIPVMAVASFIGIAISIVVSGWLSDRVGRRKPFVIASSVIAGVAAVVPLFAANLPGILTYSFIAGLGYGCYLAVDNALITQVLPSAETAAKDLGVASIGSGAATVLAPAAAGAIVVTFGSFPPLFIIALVVSLIGAVLVLPIRGAR